MKALIPAAGYATRLYPLTENKPKALLDVKGKTIIDYVVEKIEELNAVNEIIVVTNSKFYPAFKEWADNSNSKIPITILDDGTKNNDDRLGAIGDKYFAIKKLKIEEDLIDISADNLFAFSLKEMHKQFIENKETLIGLYDVGSIELAKKYGIVGVDDNLQINDFVEKPKNPPSTLASIGIYFYNKEAVKMFKDYIDEGNPSDAPGNYIGWLYKKRTVKGFVYNEQWFDIGSFEELERARKEFKMEN